MDEETTYPGLSDDDPGGEDLTEHDDAYAAGDVPPYDGNEEDERAEAGESAEETPPAPVAAAEDDYTPPAVNVPLLSVGDTELFTAEEAEQLNDMFLNGQGAQATAIIAARSNAQTVRAMQRMMQAQVVHGAALSTAESECGEWYRQHGGTIRQTLATIPPEQAGTEAAKFAALIAPALYEVQAGADAVKTFTRMARMATRTGAQSADPVAPSPQQPSAKVAPAGSRTGGVPQRRTPNVVRDMMELFGAEEGDVRRAIDAVKGR